MTWTRKEYSDGVKSLTSLLLSTRESPEKRNEEKSPDLVRDSLRGRLTRPCLATWIALRTALVQRR